MKFRTLVSGALTAGAVGAGTIGLAAPVAAAPAPVQASCPKGHICSVPAECPWEWTFHFGVGMVWKQQAYCLNPNAVPTEKTSAQHQRVSEYHKGNVY